MKKNSIKYIIDASLFINMCSIAIIGVLLAFVIPEGRSISRSKYFLGLHRHDWGEIHLYLSLLLLVLVIFHLFCNWTWIVQSSKRYFKDKWKITLWCFSFGWVLVVFLGVMIKNL